MNERTQDLMPGARVRIVDGRAGLFDEGDVLEIVKVDAEDDWLHYRLVEGELADIFDEGQSSLQAFVDGSVRWEIVQA